MVRSLLPMPDAKAPGRWRGFTRNQSLAKRAFRFSPPSPRPRLPRLDPEPTKRMTGLQKAVHQRVASCDTVVVEHGTTAGAWH